MSNFLIACRTMATVKTEIILIQSYGSMKCPRNRIISVKYFWGTVTHSKSIYLFGLLSIARSNSVTNIEKKAEFCTNNSLADEFLIAETMRQSM